MHGRALNGCNSKLNRAHNGKALTTTKLVNRAIEGAMSRLTTQHLTLNQPRKDTLLEIRHDGVGARGGETI